MTMTVPSRTFAFMVAGRAAPQGSKRHVGNGILIESSKYVGPWRERVALAAHDAMNGCPLFDGAVAVELRFVMHRPKSTPKRTTPPAVKQPDLDKIVRSTFDACTGTVWNDDSQVVALQASKRIAEIGETPGVYIRVEEVPE